TFDHVGVERSLCQKLGPFDFGGFLGKASDELVPNAATFLLWIDDPRELREKSILRLHDVQIGLEVSRELVNHRLLFVFAQESVVDEDARKLRPNRLREECRDDRRIDAAR